MYLEYQRCPYNLHIRTRYICFIMILYGRPGHKVIDVSMWGLHEWAFHVALVDFFWLQTENGGNIVRSESDEHSTSHTQASPCKQWWVPSCAVVLDVYLLKTKRFACSWPRHVEADSRAVPWPGRVQSVRFAASVFRAARSSARVQGPARRTSNASSKWCLTSHVIF